MRRVDLQGLLASVWEVGGDSVEPLLQKGLLRLGPSAKAFPQDGFFDLSLLPGMLWQARVGCCFLEVGAWEEATQRVLSSAGSRGTSLERAQQHSAGEKVHAVSHRNEHAVLLVSGRLLCGHVLSSPTLSFSAMVLLDFLGYHTFGLWVTPLWACSVVANSFFPATPLWPCSVVADSFFLGGCVFRLFALPYFWSLGDSFPGLFCRCRLFLSGRVFCQTWCVTKLLVSGH